MKINWQTKKLNDICEVEYGTRVINKKHGGSKYPVYGGGGATFFMDRFNRKDRLVIARFAMSKQCTRYISGAFFLNDSGLTISPKNNYEISQDFLDWEILYLNDYIYSLARGSAQKNLDVSAFRRIVIIHPNSIKEQKRIVKILDEVFENIEKLKNNIEKNIQNSKEIFESYLQNIFSNSRNDWEEKQLGKILQKTETINPLNKPNSEFIYIDVSSVNKETLSIENPVLMKGKDAPSRARKLIKTGDVIFATVRPTLRRIAIISKEFNKQVCSTGYLVMRANKLIDNKLVFYFLQTRMFNEKMNKLQKGASYPAVTDGEVRRQLISFPKSFSEQKEIVEKLDKLSEQTKKLEENYKKQLANLEELKKAIMKKAFNGEL